MTDMALLARDKYDGDESLVTEEDCARLASGEPLAYVIGWVPFLGLRIDLSSKPLIPRPETEWWTEQLIARLRERFEDTPFALLDLCAGSGCIGLSVLAALPNARVSFAELDASHVAQINRNMDLNGLDASRAELRASDLFGAYKHGRFKVIATNPPYVPQSRALDASVRDFEPPLALFSGEDGLACIRRIASEATTHLEAEGELWMECDESNAESAARLLRAEGAREALVRTDLYGRPRLAVAYYA